MIASTHYRKEIEFSDKLLKNASSRLNFLYDSFGIFYNMNESRKSEKDQEVLDAIKKLEVDFSKAMNNDFDTPLALSVLWSTITELRKFSEREKTIGKEAKEEAVGALLEFAKILGILEHDWYKETPSGEALG